MPIVVMNDGVKESSLKRNRQHDLPTPESPISNSLIYDKVSELDNWFQSDPPSNTDQEVIIPCACHGNI